MLKVGSSMSTNCIASGFNTSAIVSPIFISGIPATATISPNIAPQFLLLQPWYFIKARYFTLDIVPARRTKATC